ncbi:MAG: endolytic transglycosylase MltG [Lachnospiraceae bacterium]|nr:endolytic transglycosylase MltG [Lachnospiraceae bacterium]
MRKMRTTIGVVIDTLGSIIIYAVIAAAILFMAGQAKHYYDVGYGVFSQQGKDARGTGKVVAFTVEEGVKVTKLAEQLEEQGIIDSARLFLIQERVSDYAGMYVAGTYALSSEMTTEEIMRVISAKEASPYEMPVEEAAPAAEPAAEEAPAAEAPAEEQPANGTDGGEETEGEGEEG